MRSAAILIFDKCLCLRGRLQLTTARQFSFTLKMGRYIENIVDISVSDRHFRYLFFRYIDIVSVTSEISTIFGYFILLFLSFDVNLITDNYMIITEYLIKPQLVTARLRLHASMMSICLSVCLSVYRQNAKKRDFLKNYAI